MAARKVATWLAAFSFSILVPSPVFAQGTSASTVVTPTLPAPGTGAFVAGQSTPAEQSLFNFVAIPAGTTGTQPLEYRFRLPVVFNNPIVPTDVTGPGGSLGYAQGLRERILGPDRNVLPDSQGVIVARDPRYQFTGRWSPVSGHQVAIASAIPGTITLPVVVPRTADVATENFAQPYIMPTAGATYLMSAANEVTLTNGALLVKGGNAPLYVLMPLSGDTAVVRVDSGSFAMISNMDGRVTVANLDDRHNDAVMVYLTDRARKTYGEMPVRIGYMVEVYPNTIAAGQNRLVAYTVLNQLRLSNGYSVETMRLNYPRTFKRFNLTRALSEADMMRLVKTAAAVAYMDRQREVNGFTPDAQP